MTGRAFTVASLATEWECSEGVIRKLIASGELASFRIGALIRIPAAEVQRFECQNIASNDSEADTPSCGETPKVSGAGNGYMPPTSQERRRRLAKAGGGAMQPLGQSAA